MKLNSKTLDIKLIIRGEKMKKIIMFGFMFLLVMSMGFAMIKPLPLTATKTTNVAKTLSIASTGSEISSNRCKKAISTLTKLDSEEVCKTILDNTENCQKILEDKGVKRAENICNVIKGKEELFTIANKAKKIAKVKVKANVKEELKSNLKIVNKSQRNINKIEKKISRTLPKEKVRAKKVREIIKRMNKDLGKQFNALPAGIKSKLAKNDEKKVKAFIKNIKVITKDKKKLLQAKRILGKKAVEEYKKELSRIKKAKDLHRNKFTEDRSEFISMKKQLRECKGKNDSKCREARQNALEKTKKFVDRSINMALSYLEEQKIKAQSQADLTEEEVKKIVNNIDIEIQELKSISEDLDKAESPAQVNNIIMKVKKEWRKVKRSYELNKNLLAKARISKAVNKILIVQSKIDCAKEEVEKNNLTIEDLDPLIESFNNLVQDIYSGQEELEAMLDDTEKLEENKALETLEEVNRYKTELIGNIKESYKIAKKIYRLLQENNISLRSCSEKISMIKSLKPEYNAGDDLGAYVWQNPTGLWIVCASGDSLHKNKTENRILKAEITISADKFCDINPFLTEKNDYVNNQNNTLKAVFYVSKHQDCLQFKSSQNVTFNIKGLPIYYGFEKEAKDGEFVEQGIGCEE
jgi:DNA repair exonuclease SbcCD ATPase subunit